MRAAPLLLLLGLASCASRSDGWVDHRWRGDGRVFWYHPSGSGEAPTRAAAMPSALRGLQILQARGLEWAYGIPDHPALDLAAGPEPGSSRMFTLYVGDGPKAALWRKLPRFLFQLGPKGDWKRMGQYCPWLDGHGPLQALEALEDGTFLALSPAWFRDGERASPCARYALGAGGELTFQGLVNLRVDRALPKARPGLDGADQAWTPWREGVRVAREGKVFLLVAESMDWVTLVDPKDGEPLRAVALPRSPGGARLTYPDFLMLPDGRIYFTGGQAAHGREAPRSPGGELAADLLGLPERSDQVVRAAYRLELRTGSWIREEMPTEAFGAEAPEAFTDPGRVTVVPTGRPGTPETMR